MTSSALEGVSRVPPREIRGPVRSMRAVGGCVAPACASSVVAACVAALTASAATRLPLARASVTRIALNDASLNSAEAESLKLALDRSCKGMLTSPAAPPLIVIER